MSDTGTTIDTIVSGKVPKGFWNLEAFNAQPDLKEIHAAIVERLQIESPDSDTLELMMMERVSFLYIFMRASEVPVEGEVISFDKNYKDMMSLWVSMAADLRKQRMRAEEMQGIRYQIISEVSKAIKEALKDVDPKISKDVQTKLVTLVAV